MPRAFTLPAAAVLSAAVLAACEAPAPGCQSPAAREIRVVDRLIAETRANLDRGYTTERTGSDFNFCLGGAGDNVGVSFCNGIGGNRAVPLDRAAETRKLEALQQRRAALATQATGDAALCAGGA
ncbi:MAG: hypothetical protein ACKVPY_03795 [Paracoccaceae bacterium]